MRRCARCSRIRLPIASRIHVPVRDERDLHAFEGPRLSTPPVAPSRADEPQPSPERWLGLIGLCLGVFMFTLDSSIVNVALPTLVTAFGTTFATIQWVVLAYLLIATALVMAAARIGRHLRQEAGLPRRAGHLHVGSLLCGLAPSVGWLIACRALQGLGAVFVSALGAAIVGEMFATNERGRALGMIGSAVLLGVAIGPIGGRPHHRAGPLALDVLRKHSGGPGGHVGGVPLRARDPGTARLRGIGLARHAARVRHAGRTGARTHVGSARRIRDAARPDTVDHGGGRHSRHSCMSNRASPRPILDLRVFRNKPFRERVVDGLL